MRAELGVINRFGLVLVSFSDDVLHLSHQLPTRCSNCPTGCLQPILRLAHERRLDPTGRHQLRRASRHVVTGHDQLLRRVATGDYSVRCLDQGVGRAGDRLGCGDEPLCPPVVLLVEGRLGGATPSLTDNLLLRDRRGLDQLGNGISNGNGRLQD